MSAAGLVIPNNLPDKGVVDCKHVGELGSALEYLSCYLYRDVISETNIVANRDGKVMFRYVEGGMGMTQYHTLKGEAFLWLVLQHVLPKGFRRVRDYVLLRRDAKKLLLLVQLVLQVVIDASTPRQRPVFSCLKCRSPMQIPGFFKPAWQSG